MEKIIELAGLPLRLQYTHIFPAYAEQRLNSFLCTDRPPLFTASVSQEHLDERRPLYPGTPSESYLEWMELYPQVSRAMLPYGRVFFHGATFLWHGRAFVFTACSGTGKSTQYVLWKKRYGDEIQCINGDKPVLEFCEDGEIIAHTSPWRGKEDFGRMLSAPLGGLIYLRQAQENQIRRMPPQEAVAPLLFQFLIPWVHEEDILSICAMEEKLLQHVPVWLLENRGDEASAALAYDTIRKELSL